MNNKTYPKSIRDKSVSELIRMGYTDAEINEITKAKKFKAQKAIAPILALVGIYLAITIGGTIKVQKPYDTLQKVIALSDAPVQFIEKSFFGHLKAVAPHPAKAWHYIVSDEELIYLELMIEYGQAAGMDTGEMEEFYAMYGFYK